jgi:hypothetical protein
MVASTLLSAEQAKMASPHQVNGCGGAFRGQQPDRVGLGGGFQAGDQVAEQLGAGDPGGVHERGQPDQLGDVG